MNDKARENGKDTKIVTNGEESRPSVAIQDCKKNKWPNDVMPVGRYRADQEYCFGIGEY